MDTFSALLALCEGIPPATGGFPSQRASDAELWCFLWSAPEQTVEQTTETPVIWDAIAHYDVTVMSWQLYRSGMGKIVATRQTVM